VNFILTVLWNWLKDSSFHKTAASAAAGTSVGMLTVLGLLEQKIETVRAEVKVEITQLQGSVTKIDDFVQHRKEITDERFEHIDQSLKYLRGAIDVTNQNILNLGHDLKRSRN
jgi:peptidoglycan hydrolase CwlO-like protein